MEGNNTIAIVKHVLVDPPSKQNGPFLEERSHLGGCALLGSVRRCSAGVHCWAALGACWSARLWPSRKRRLRLT